MPHSFVCLGYHRVTNATTARRDPYTVHPARFAAQMRWLKRRGYTVVPLGEALRAPRPRTLALTFDDGSADFADHALPVLRAFGFRATLFVVAGRVGRTADWPGAAGMSLLGWVALQLLAEEGMEIGAHGLTHHPLDGLTTPRLRAELAEAYTLIAAQLGQPPAGLAYPYGRCTNAVAEAAQAAGFRWACTARGGRNRPATPRYRLRRTLVTGRDGLVSFALKVISGYAGLVDLRMDVRQVP